MRFLLSAAVLVLLLLSACNPKKQEVTSNSPVLARVNNQTITSDELRSYYTMAQWDSITQADKRAFVKRWTDLSLLAQAADSTGISFTPGVKAKIDAAIQKVKANSYVASVMAGYQPSETELIEYYKINSNRYLKDATEYKAQVIMVRSGDELDTVLDALSNGTEFAQAAKDYSKHGSAANGGYLGFVAQGDVNAEVWQKLVTLEKYARGVAYTDRGTYLIRWYDKRTVQVEKTFDDARAEITKEFGDKKKQELYQTTIDQLKLKADVELRI